ncbi:MAG: DHH family phosphoesterase [Candidatus Cloacimonetes bacterium]|nr:DHH family phosphoesterase [Candidatus Cloacimonadota bacterium]
MLKWHLVDRVSPSLKEHLRLTKSTIDVFIYSETKLYEYYGHNIPDEKIMKNLLTAAQRIIKAVRKQEKIIIFGHDDLDGITSTYILFDFLSYIGSQNHYYYIPNRMQEHHGIQSKFIDKVREEGHSLVVTVDGGITSIEGVEQINQLGCETIITDHHIVPEKLPDAYTIVNPKQTDCPYPYDMLAGVGVTFFLVKAMAELLEVKQPENYILWTAIGTIADKAPMTGVNRVLCQIALQRWFAIDDTTLMLCPNYNLVGDNYFSKMAFITNLIKLFNNGRDDDGENTALYLLLAPVYKKRELIASLLPKKNEYENTLHHVKKIIDKKLPSKDEIFYIFKDDRDEIPYVFLGWAANYISYLFKIPVIMLKKKEENYVCEARCTEGFDLVKAFDFAQESLDQYGGHIRAAGFLTHHSKIERFIELFSDYANQNREFIEQKRVINIDAEIVEEDLNDLPELLSYFAPYGENALEPVFLIRNYRIEKLLDNNCPISFKTYEINHHYDIVFTFKPDGKYLILDFKESIN